MTQRRPELPEGVSSRLAELERLLKEDPTAPIGAGTTDRAAEVHIADSLSGLEVPELATAKTICDLGSGAGLPGLVLAAALPARSVVLLESVGRKCAFMRRAAERMELENVEVVNARSEGYASAGGRERFAGVTARAVADLAVLVELSSPLLRTGGVLVAWKGGRSEAEEGAAKVAAARTAMELLRVIAVQPYAGSRDRHLHLYRKSGSTPDGLPRRPGRAAKRPLGT